MRDPEVVDRAVERVFSDPALAEGLERSHAGWLEVPARIWEWILDLLGDLRRAMDGLYLNSPGLFWLIFAVLVIILVLLLAHIGWTFSVAFRRPPPRGDDAEGATTSQHVRRFRDLRREAREQASRGNLREATHLLLLALLALIEEARVFGVALGWTNREIFSRLRLRAELAGELASFERAVERVWYGDAPIGEEDFRRLDGMLDGFAPHISGGSEVAP